MFRMKRVRLGLSLVPLLHPVRSLGLELVVIHISRLALHPILDNVKNQLLLERGLGLV